MVSIPQQASQFKMQSSQARIYGDEMQKIRCEMKMRCDALWALSVAAEPRQ